MMLPKGSYNPLEFAQILLQLTRMTNRKIGRNDPCPCGSGKKYKQCCLHSESGQPASARITDAEISHTLQAAIRHHQAGQIQQAEVLYQQILQARPSHTDALHLLGVVAYQNGQYQISEELIRKAIQNKTDFAIAYSNLGNTLRSQGKLDEAIDNFHQALKLKPDSFEAYNNLGNALLDQGRLEEAATSYQQAIALKPDYAEAYYNLGKSLKAQGQSDNAVASFSKAIQIKPDYAAAYGNTGDILAERGRLKDAITLYQHALRLKPDFVEMHNNMGKALMNQCRIDEAIASFQQALKLKPTFDPYCNILFALNYHPDLSAEDIYKVYQEYDASQCAALRSTWRAHDNDRNPDRRLRIGYVSPDFRRHSSGNFLELLLARHDPAKVEVHAYAELSMEDETTERYKSYVEHWVPTRGMSDEALTERIRNDGIDILVDLAGHTAGNRLLVFARKPAPVSVSWLGYGYTTGLSAIDYYLTDETCAPPGSDSLFAEHPWRIATPSFAYRPVAGMGEVSRLPALQNGHITFGVLSRSIRINHRTIQAWAEILRAVPNSRLVIDSAYFTDPPMQELMAARFAEHDIARDRLEIGFHSPPWDVLRSIDIGLDCFPHNSGTTLFETLYMGIPYVTLAGRPSVGRLGSSILIAAGHPEWIARDENEYVSKAVELAKNTGLLSEMRANLRGQMASGVLMDEQGFVLKVEDAYRKMWQIWCKEGGQL